MPFKPGNELGKTDANTGRDKNPENASELRIVRGNLKGLKKKSLDILKASLEYEDESDGEILQEGKTKRKVSKEQVNTARWVINTMITVHKAIVAEENNSNPEVEDPVDEETETGTVFSLYQVKSDLNKAQEGKPH